jgi:hypothetical protein
MRQPAYEGEPEARGNVMWIRKRGAGGSGGWVRLGRKEGVHLKLSPEGRKWARTHPRVYDFSVPIDVKYERRNRETGETYWSHWYIRDRFRSVTWTTHLQPDDAGFREQLLAHVALELEMPGGRSGELYRVHGPRADPESHGEPPAPETVAGWTYSVLDFQPGSNTANLFHDLILQGYTYHTFVYRPDLLRERALDRAPDGENCAISQLSDYWREPAESLRKAFADLAAELYTDPSGYPWPAPGSWRPAWGVTVLMVTTLCERRGVSCHAF